MGLARVVTKNGVSSYRGPKEKLNAFTSEVQTNGFVPWSNWCVAENCIYNIQFAAPAYQCSYVDKVPNEIYYHFNFPLEVPLPGVWPGFYWAKVFGPEVTLDSQGLWITYDAAPKNRTIQCKLYSATYKVKSTFINSTLDEPI
jgi:hypothetical protein